ncbi:gamma tubulin-interacting protein [Chloropicon primus]|uniref:Gamma-tubulin complex component n=1 Tax=Chloropicon primus TaxID=1764295 RepID=A0A5B8MWL4_9CHLO|nr:gamma tubulin-interacting protein [Chloropicon primus]|eukprot:QDZ23952.1 gamma tubulin-interacting protein [Chloropicon primus]
MTSTSGKAVGLLPSRTLGGGQATGRTYDRSSGETQAELLRLVKRLNRVMGLPPGRATDGVATASAQMLSKMVSRYEVTRVSIQQTQRTIEQHSQDYETFFGAYSQLKEDLKEANSQAAAGHLDRYLTVVARVLGDKDLREMLTTTASAPGGSKSGAGATSVAAKLASMRDLGKENSRVPPPSASPYKGGQQSYSSRRPELNPPVESVGTLADTSGFAVRSPYRENVANREQKLHVGEISGSFKSPSRKKLSFRETPAEAAGGTPGEEARGDDKAFEDSRYLLRTAAGQQVESSSRRQGQYLHLGRGEEGSGSPQLPQWALSHPVIYSGQGVGSLLVDEGQTSNVDIHPEHATLEPELQELMLIDDLLYVFLGSKGKLIYPRYTNENERIDFVIDPSLDYSLRMLAEKFLPICLSLQVLQVYIETRFDYKFGLVNHALAAMVKELVWEWRLLVSQMESILQDGKLSLHSMWYYCQPSVGMLKTVSDMLTKIINEDLRGAEVLNAIHDTLQNNKGDQSRHQVVLSLMKGACKPYLKMLRSWLYEGKVEDPYNEFCIVKHQDIEKESLAENIMSTYWQQCYSLRESVPHFLQGYTNKVLRTGKYLNVVKECQSASSVVGEATSHPADIIYEPNNRNLLATLERAYNVASQSLLSFLHEKVDIVGRLRSIKRYFLLDQGDFLLHFIDSAGDELEKDISQVSVRRLQSLFELAVKMSSSATDPYNEDAFCNVSTSNATDTLSNFFKGTEKGRRNLSALERLGLETSSIDKKDGAHLFRMDYKVSWPFSLLVTRKTLMKYQLIFSHLFQFKFLERKLAMAWQDQQLLRRQRLDGTEGSLKESLMCKEMLHFVNNYLSYLTFETIEPKWQQLEEKLLRATNLDECIESHEAFLDQVIQSSETYLQANSA